MRGASEGIHEVQRPLRVRLPAELRRALGGEGPLRGEWCATLQLRVEVCGLSGQLEAALETASW